MGHSALKMCYNCNISKPPNPPTEKAPLGYDSPTLQTLPASNREAYVLIYDVRMKFTHEQIMDRGAPFIHGWSQGDPKVVGCHAQPLLPLLLQHLDARLAHLVPVYHSFMYGLLKHQLEWFMSADGLHIDVRREIVKRGAAIQSPSDLGRDLGDLANRTGWRMEDYKHWYVHFSPIVLRGNLLPQPYRGLWTALEGAMLHYLTPGSENSATPEGMAAGYAHLKTYAARLERCRRDPQLPAAHGDNEGKLSVPTDQVCPNLHTTACSKRLLDRAEPEAQQDYKARLKDELTQDGQQALLLGAGSAECPLQNSPGAMMRGCMKAVQDLQNSDEATPWRPWHVKQVFVRYYQRADCNGTIVFSSVYKRPSTRNNTWVSIPFELDDDKWAIWAGHVQFWVRLEHPKLPGVFLRLAVRLFPGHIRQQELEQRLTQEERPQQSAMGSMHQGYGDQHWYMFDATKIFTVFVTSFEDGEGYGRMFFVPAHSLSRS
ncbi:hypothetical protein V8C86DRAFT_3035253 [Haematococcus lacustris]